MLKQEEEPYQPKPDTSINSQPGEWEYLPSPTKPTPDKSLPPFSYPSIIGSEAEAPISPNSKRLSTEDALVTSERNPQVHFLNVNKEGKLVDVADPNGKLNNLGEMGEILQIKQTQTQTAPITLGRRMIGWGFALLSALFACVIYFMVKLLMDDYDYSPIEQIFIRGYYFTLISTIGMYANKTSILQLTQNERKVCYLRTFLLVSCHMFMYYFLDYLSITVFTLLFLTYTIFTPIWSRIILKESLSNIYFIFLAISILGVFFLLQPTFLFGGEGEENTSHIMFYVAIFGTLVAANCKSSIMVVCKAINCSVNIFTINLFVGPTSTLGAGLIWYLILKRSSDFGLVGLLLIGVTHSIFYLVSAFTYFAISFEQPSIVALICYSQILFTYIAELLFYDLEMGIYDLIGALILAASTFGLLIYNYLSQKRKEK